MDDFGDHLNWGQGLNFLRNRNDDDDNNNNNNNNNDNTFFFKCDCTDKTHYFIPLD